MTKNVQFVLVDLRIHRSQLMDLNVEYMNWWLRGIEECFKTDLATLLGWSKEAVENKKRARYPRVCARRVAALKLLSDRHG